MFRLLTLLFKLAIYLGAPLTIIAATVAGGVLATTPEIGLPGWLGYLLGGVLGIFIAAAVFGLPLIVLAIHNDLLQVQAAVQRRQLTAGSPPPASGVFDAALAPVLAERMVERWLGD